jgi:microsomal dipeptidase-like Zn-dependent dipeptidase
MVWACGDEGEEICVDLDLYTGSCNPDKPWLRAVYECHGDLCPVWGWEWICKNQWTLIDEPDCGCDVPDRNDDIDVGIKQMQRGPVRGIADTHTHQFSNLAYGGALLWGKPFDERGINAALAPCDFTWDFRTMTVLDVGWAPHPDVDDGWRVHNDIGADLQQILTQETQHWFDWEGADAFSNWPKWNSTLHQQMYHRWLKRAYKGGLRLWVTHAVNNEFLCKHDNTRKRIIRYGEGGDPWLPEYDCSDMYTVDEQLDEIKAMEKYIDREDDGLENDTGWFKIVYSPYEARKAIRDGKMAVVLGIEVDGLFGCKTLDNCKKTDILGFQDDLDEYHDYFKDVDGNTIGGVRHLFPIHLYDNSFGGAAFYMSPFFLSNKDATGRFMELEDCEDTKAQLTGPLAVNTPTFEFKLFDDTELWEEVLLRNALSYPYLCPNLDPFVWNSDFCGYPSSDTGHCNKEGLTPFGESAIESMMDRKFIIDVDHLSLRSLDWVLGKAQERAYPVIASHSYLADRPLTEEGKAKKVSEGHRTKNQIEIIRDLGGLVAPLIPRHEGSSTRDYVHMYRYLVEMMKTPEKEVPGIPFATDWGALYRQTAPRCKSGNCQAQSEPVCQAYCVDEDDTGCIPFIGYPESGCEGKDFPKLEYSWVDEDSRSWDGFKAVHVEGVFYKHQTGGKTFDFNKHGLAHVGLMPDFIKDLTYVGLDEEAGELEPLFRSAEAYIGMWETVCGGPPAITPNISGTEGNNGWYRSDVTVEWDIVSDSTIQEKDSCGRVTITEDTAGITLTCWAASDCGEAEESITIKRDTVPPVVGCTAKPRMLWPPNHKMVPVTVATTLTDSLSGPASMTVTTSACNEPDTGTGKGDRPGDMEGFWLGSSNTEGELRSERMGKGSGRVYTLGYTGKDMAGNAASCSTTVSVPHDRSAAKPEAKKR